MFSGWAPPRPLQLIFTHHTAAAITTLQQGAKRLRLAAPLGQQHQPIETQSATLL
jgi:hypothetical protein